MNVTELRTHTRLAGARARRALLDLGLPLRHRTRVVFHPDYVVAVGQGAGPLVGDLRRPARIVERLRLAGLLCRAGEVSPLAPVSGDDLARVHPPAYLERTGTSEHLSAFPGVAPGALLVDGLLRPLLLQTAGTCLALEQCLSGRTPVVNLGGGFHGASRDHASGVSPINDVAVAIERARARGLARRFLVVDLGYHRGDGTAQIFAEDPDVFTLSIHAPSRLDGTPGDLDIVLPPDVRDDEYLAALRGCLDRVLAEHRPDACIYVAGVDVHEADAVGDLALSEDCVLARDLYVVAAARAAAVPLAVVMGGGHGPLAWTLTYNMVHSLMVGEPLHRALRPGNIEAAYRKIYGTLNSEELRRGEAELTYEGVEAMLTGRQTGDELFMDAYTAEGLGLALERYGFFDLLRDRGFSDLLVSVDTGRPRHHLARIHFQRRDPEHLLVELAVQLRTVPLPRTGDTRGDDVLLRLLSIEWLLMQDPTSSFAPGRRGLPGQQRPGLGLGRWMVVLLSLMAERLGCDGLLAVPDHYHNAAIYSRMMLCLDPERQGYLEALRRDLDGLSLVEAAEAVHRGQVKERAGRAVVWEGMAQVLPLRPRLNAHLASPAYVETAAAWREHHRFTMEHEVAGPV